MRKLPVVALLLLAALPARGQAIVKEGFAAFVDSRPTATPPYTASDYLALTRDGVTLKVPGTALGGIVGTNTSALLMISGDGGAVDSGVLQGGWQPISLGVTANGQGVAFKSGGGGSTSGDGGRFTIGTGDGTGGGSAGLVLLLGGQALAAGGQGGSVEAAGGPAIDGGAAGSFAAVGGADPYTGGNQFNLTNYGASDFELKYGPSIRFDVAPSHMPASGSNGGGSFIVNLQPAEFTNAGDVVFNTSWPIAGKDGGNFVVNLGGWTGPGAGTNPSMSVLGGPLNVGTINATGSALTLNAGGKTLVMNAGSGNVQLTAAAGQGLDIEGGSDASAPGRVVIGGGGALAGNVNGASTTITSGVGHGTGNGGDIVLDPAAGGGGGGSAAGRLKINTIANVGAGTGKFFVCLDGSGYFYKGTGVSCN